MYKSILLKIVILTLLFTSCSKFQKANNEIIDVNLQNTESIIEEIVEPVVIEPVVPKVYNLNILSDLVEFSSLDTLFKDIVIKSDKYAVVGNKETILFEPIDIQNSDDLVNLKEIQVLTPGTIIPLEKMIVIQNTIHENYFIFGGESNYFYETTVDGVQGVVWGANLIVDIKDKTEALWISHQYSKDIKRTPFLPYNGNYRLSNKNIADISTNRLSFEDVKTPETIVSLYKNDSNVRNNTIFITTDLMLNTLFNLTKEFRKTYESDVIRPQLDIFVDGFLEVINNYIEQDDKINDKYSDLLVRSKNFFLLSQLLINDSKVLKDIMPQIVVDEYDLIKNGSEITNSPILKYKYNYTVFTEKNIHTPAVLWLTDSNIDLKMSLLINKIIKDQPELYNIWENIITDIRYLGGDSNDLELEQTQPMVDDYGFSIFPSWIQDDKNINDFIEKNRLLSETFRIFGKRTNLDENIFKQLLVEIQSRENSSNLDFMAILGSKTAKNLLDQLELDSTYKTEYFIALNNITTEVNEYTNDYWTNSYYRNSINLLKSIFTFEQNRDFYFTEKGKWNQKTLITSHGGLTNLKNNHYVIPKDMLLEEEKYPTDISFDIDMYNRPIHFVEPNIEFFEKYSELIKGILNNLNFDNIDNLYKSKFDRLINISDNLLDIVNKEVNNDPITGDENNYIVSIPSLLYRINNTDSPIINNNGQFNIGTGIPKRMFIALKNDHGGSRIATGYVYSYYEFTTPIGTNINSEEWIENVYNNGSDLKDFIPFWEMDKLK